MPADPNRVKELFLAAAELPAAGRPAFLAGACGGDAELLAAVERLLAAHDTPDSRLDRPGGDPGATSAAGSEPPAGDRPDDRGLVLVGRYKLVERIGEGGMGSVWMAQQVEPVKRAVAVKLIKAGMDSAAVLARFEAERQALALMDHPNIAKVLDAGLSADRRPFFVMELVKGVPITEFCDARKLTPKERLELFVPVCQAVQHAHMKGVIHRDIKPSNVLVALYDDRPVPKVIDFGVAKAAGQPLTDRTLMTGFGAVVGTPEYMSPEQASFNNLDVDTRSDVYALGVLLYELLTGSPPHPRKELERAGLLEVLRVIREVEPPRPSTRLSSSETLANIAAVRGTEPARLTRQVRGELDWIVMKALEKDRARRYETANGFAAEVQRYLAGEPVQAVPPSAGYRLRKFVRRHRAGVLTAAGFVVLLLLGAGVSAWQAVVATRAERDANTQRDAADQAREAEAGARAQAESALNDSREKTARMTYERAQALCEEGQADLGLLWMARSLDLTPPGAGDLDRAIRASMNLWARQLNTVRRVLAVPADFFAYAAVSPDGRSLLTVGEKGLVHLHDLATGQARRTLPLESDPPPVGFQPPRLITGWGAGAFSRDGRFVAATRGDPRARVWDAASGEPVGKPLTHDAPVSGVSFGPAGKVLATAAGKVIRFWNIESAVQDSEPLPLGREAGGVEFSGDGRLLLGWSQEQILVWEYPSRKLLRPLSGVDFAVYSAAFSPDGRFVLANGEQEAQFWAVATGKPVGARMRWRDQASPQWHAHRCGFRADGKVAVTGGFPVHLWEVPSGKPLGATSLSIQSYCPVFGPDGTSLVAAEQSRGSIYDVAPGLLPSQQLARGKSVRALVAGPGGESLAAVEEESGRFTCQLLDLPLGRAVGDPVELVRTHGKRPLTVYSPDGRAVAVLTGKNDCELRDTATGRAGGPRLVMDSDIGAVAFSPGGQVIATGDRGGVVRLWSRASGQPFGKPLAHRHSVWRLRFSPDGSQLLAAGGKLGSIYGEARLWDVASGEPLGPALEILGEVHDAAISPDGKSFATGAFQLNLWDSATSQPLWTASLGDIGQLAFSPDGRQVLARSRTLPKAGLYDTRSGSPTASLRHRNAPTEAAFSPDGRLVLTCSEDMTARLWDAATGLPLGPVWQNAKAIPQGAWAADGKSVLLAEDGGISRWEIAPPLEGTREQIRLAVEVATRLLLDEHGELQPLAPLMSPQTVRQKRAVLTPDPYEPARKRLEELGGPPGYFRR